MPKGDCKFLEQYKKDHPNWQSEVPKVTKQEEAVDSLQKGNGSNKEPSWEEVKQILEKNAGHIIKRFGGINNLQKEWEEYKNMMKSDASARFFALSYVVNYVTDNTRSGFIVWSKRKNKSPIEIAEMLGYDYDDIRSDEIYDAVPISEDVKEDFIGCFHDTVKGQDVSLFRFDFTSAEHAVFLRALRDSTSDNGKCGVTNIFEDTVASLVEIAPTTKEIETEVLADEDKGDWVNIKWGGNDGFPNTLDEEKLKEAKKIWGQMKGKKSM